MLTLEDALVDAVVADPADPVPKLVLADLLAERGLDSLAHAARWCAWQGLWPYPLTLSRHPGWQWVRSTFSVGPDQQYACAILPDALTDAMDCGIWCADSCQGALAILALALARLPSQCPRG